MNWDHVMRRRAFISVAAAALLLVVILGTGSFAGAVRNGATMQVRADSIWFQDAAQLAHWQRLKQSGNAAALASYQAKVLSNRDAWQFTNPLTVKILRYEPGKNRVNVEMKTPGRLFGTPWVLDAGALLP